MKSTFAIAGILFLFACLVRCIPDQTKNIPQTLFRKVPPKETGILFNNELIESEDFNIIEYLYFYNGGGVAIGDINNDGLSDIYFSSNQSANKLYLNKGKLQFEDITSLAGVEGIGNWKTGVAMVDINADGVLDIFSCGVGSYKKFNGRNQVLINQGDLTFVDKTEELGLTFQGFSTHVAFLDYDLDGDLDIYLLNHSVHTVRSYGDVSLRNQSDAKAGDKLYENQLVPAGRTFFKEVTSKAGIFSSQIGYGLGVGVSDLNNDGWPEIYVSNDFHENDYLYINNKDKTFSQVAEKTMTHTSRFSMGNDIADINNDGLTDIVTLDMLPSSEEVRKASAGEDPYEIFQFKLKFGYHVQLASNALQLNRGIGLDGLPYFSDIAPMAGVEATDWSWAPLLADFDNDGYKDLFVANGIRRRPNDMDYINFISNDSVKHHSGYREFLSHMPEGKVPDFFYRNHRGILFDNVSEEWIGGKPDFSNGAAYADLDNDGDLDLVVNHINQVATIYENQSDRGNNSLGIKLNGPLTNPSAIGAKVWVYDSVNVQLLEQYPSRGWQSSVDFGLHVGLGNSTEVDSIVVRWPDGTCSVRKKIKSGKVDFNFPENLIQSCSSSRTSKKPLFKEVDLINYTHREDDYTEFEKERLIPHSLATQGPKISVGDLNKDGMEDVFIGGAAGQRGKIFIQNLSGGFTERRYADVEADSSFEDTGSAIFDANGDGWNDLMVANGLNGNNDKLIPRLYLNDKKGKLVRAPGSIPDIFPVASCVRPVDFDNDGDWDVFIGSRVVAGHYGVSPVSHLLINNGKGVFTDANNILPLNSAIGLVTDAQWVDLNNDNLQDLIVSGEWMPVSVFIQENQKLVDITESFGLSSTNGWWNCLELADVDNDGDQDLLAGNLGLNSRLRASGSEPVSLYVGDIDQNGSVEQILTQYENNKPYPFVSRDQLIKQVPSLKKKFLRFADFKNVLIEDIIMEERMAAFVQKNVFIFESSWFRNDGGHFEKQPFPIEAQMFPVESIKTSDINHDGQIDFLAGGGLHPVQPELGQYDAGYGLAVLGNGKGEFKSLPIESGFFVKGEIRDIQFIKTRQSNSLVIITVNNAPVKVLSIMN